MAPDSSTIIVALGLLILAGCAGPGPPAMIFPESDWVEAAPESQAVDPAGLAAAVTYLERNAPRDGVRELIVVRNGRLIWKGTGVDKVHGVWSITKAFTSAVL
ncbi:MAG: hypothetical protein GY953_31515, partial [bacterium]|nr:hypothetical protein [bacterium]